MANNSSAVNVTTTLFLVESTKLPWEVAVIASVFCAIIAIFGALANAFVIFLIHRIRNHQDLENMDKFVASLCLSDLLSSLILQPQLIAYIVTRSQVPSLQVLTAQATNYITIITGVLGAFFVTLDRYISLRFPYSYTSYITNTTVHCCLAITWLTGTAMFVWTYLDTTRVALIFQFAIFLVFSITFLFQALIFRIVHMQNRNMRRQIISLQHNHVQNDVARATSQHRLKTNKTILYICIVFIAAWLPSVLFRLYLVYRRDMVLFLRWIPLFNMLLQVHACINPFIYALRTARIKRVFVRLFSQQ